MSVLGNGFFEFVQMNLNSEMASMTNDPATKSQILTIYPLTAIRYGPYFGQEPQMVYQVYIVGFRHTL